MQKIKGLAVLCASGLAVAGMAAPQNAAPVESGVTIRTTVSEVALDLVVRDKKGKVVKTVKPGDVEIYEDGVRQQLLSFRLVSGPSAQELAPVPGATSGTTKPLSLPLKAVNVVCIVFQGLDLNTKKWAVEAVREFLKSDLPQDSWVGIFNLGARLSVLQPFTTDRNALILAAKNAFAGPTLDFVAAANTVLSMNPMVVTADEGGIHVSGGEINSAAIGDVNVETSASANAQRADLASQNRQFSHIEASRQTDQLVTMIQQLATLPGRKTILLLTPGLTSTGDPDRFHKILASAAKANMTFYGVDAHGLGENSTAMSSSAALSHVVALSQQQQGSTGTSTATVAGVGSVQTTPTGGAGQSMALMRQDDELRNAVRGSDPQATLRALSEGTGGFMIANSNDLRKPFQHIVDDLDTHYEAIYRSSTGKLDGRLRKLEIKLAKADLTVDSRAGYFAMPDLKGSPMKPYEMVALMALSQKPEPHAFDFRASAYQFRPQGENSQFAVAFEVPISNLTATPIADQKKHRLHLSVFGLVKDGDGQVVDKFSQDSSYDVADDNLAAVESSPITYSHPLNLPAGRYTVETVVADREGRKVATGVISIDNPERKGLSLSSVMLVKQLEAVVGQGDPTDPFQFQGRRVVPEMAASLPPTAQPYLYFVIYPDKSNAEKPAVQIQVLLNGEVVAEQDADLASPDPSGAFQVVIGGAPAKPGNYELKVTALQGNDSVEQSARYSVADQPGAAAQP
ncbi:MAG: VWA domain-containing protein [Bryobacteraceae bacterium]|jgi:VWFA-related protein